MVAWVRGVGMICARDAPDRLCRQAGWERGESYHRNNTGSGGSQYSDTSHQQPMQNIGQVFSEYFVREVEEIKSAIIITLCFWLNIVRD